MNFYKHHIGDYAQATAHLSFVEDAAYSRLIRKYYAEEKPLPADIKSVQRIVAARSREEREAVETVLNEFFVLNEDGWHNKRCDSELDAWRKQAEANRRTAEEREAKKRKNKSSNNSSTNRADYDNDSLHESFNESSTVAVRSREPNQNPESRIQNPRSNNTIAVSDDDATPNGAQGVVLAVADWSPTDEIYFDLEINHYVPVEFARDVFAEWQAFYVDKAPQLASTWHSRFIQRVVEQWARFQRGAA